MAATDEITGMSAQDTALWRAARTLSDLGELTARWCRRGDSAALCFRWVPAIGPERGPARQVRLRVWGVPRGRSPKR